MKLLVEVLAGLAACAAAYYVARPDPSSSVNEPEPHAAVAAEGPASPVAVSSSPRRLDPPRVHVLSSVDAGPSVEEQQALITLRNEVISAASADMQRRGANVTNCLAGAELAVVEKLRFSVHVASSAHEGTTGQWHFVEIVDGEPLPDSFAACAARALGGGQHLVPPKGHAFPEYSGDLEIIYTIPAPVAR